MEAERCYGGKKKARRGGARVDASCRHEACELSTGGYRGKLAEWWVFIKRGPYFALK